MDKDTLLKLSKELNCEEEPGITNEIEFFLENCKNVRKYNLEYHSNYFFLSIELKNYKLCDVGQLFHSLVNFIEYKSTFYVQEDYDDKIEYLILSSMVSKKAFMCKIIFSSKSLL